MGGKPFNPDKELCSTDKKGKVPVVFEGGIPTEPDRVKNDKEAHAIWVYLIEEMGKADNLSRLSTIAMQRYCTVYSALLAAEDAGDGKEARALDKQLMAWSDRLGLDPKSQKAQGLRPSSTKKVVALPPPPTKPGAKK